MTIVTILKKNIDDNIKIKLLVALTYMKNN